MGNKPISIESAAWPQVLLLVPILWLRRVHIDLADLEGVLLFTAFQLMGLD